MKKIIDVIRWIVQNFPIIKQVFDLLHQIIGIIKDIVDELKKKPDGTNQDATTN
jgi:uncharacterized membrane protein